MVIAGKSLQLMPVRLETVTPVVIAHQFARLLELGNPPGQAVEQVPDLAQFVHRERLGLNKSLENTDRQPEMQIDQRSADANDVHRGKNTGPAEIVRLGGTVIRKQSIDVGCTPPKTGDRKRVV